MIITQHGINSLQRKKPQFLTYINEYVSDGQRWKVLAKTGQTSNTINDKYDSQTFTTPIGVLDCSKLKLNNNCIFSLSRMPLCSGEFFVLSDSSFSIFDVGFPRLCGIMGTTSIMERNSSFPFQNTNYKLSFTIDSRSRVNIVDATYLLDETLYVEEPRPFRAILLLKNITGWNFFSYTYDSINLKIFINGILTVIIEYPYITQNNFVFSLYEIFQPTNTFCTQAAVFDYDKSIGSKYPVPTRPYTN